MPKTLKSIINRLKQKNCNHSYILNETIIHKDTGIEEKIYICKKCGKHYLEIDC